MSFDPTKPVQAASGCDTGTRVFDPSKPVMTRDGRPARIICTDANFPDHSVVALIKSKYSDIDSLQVYDQNGKYCPDKTLDYDLVNIPTKRTGWINIYKDNWFRGVFETKEEANKNSINRENYITTIQIEWEE